MKPLNKKTLALGILVSLLGAGIATASNGKPFIELEGEIVEVQGQVTSLADQIDALVGTVDTLEGRLDADELLLADLEQQTADLEAELAATGADLQGQIDDNYDLIAALENEINDLLLDLDEKQNSIEGSCSAGYAIREVLSDGSVVCEPTGGGGGTLNVVRTFNFSDVSVGQTSSVVATCPAGYTPTGGGYGGVHAGVVVTYDRPYTTTGWEVRFYNGSTLGRRMFTYAQCLSL